MIWLLLLLVPLIFSVGFLTGCWFSTGGRCRRGGYMPPPTKNVHVRSLKDLSVPEGTPGHVRTTITLEAQEYRPPYTGER